MSEKFVASNGVEIGKLMHGWQGEVRADDYGLSIHGVSVGTPGVKALREFFRHERDEELGRWRSKIDPNWTAVLDEEHVKFRHDNGLLGFYLLKDAPDFKAWTGELRVIGQEYFAAHPERKPWHAAKPGEVWALLMDGRERWLVCRVTHTGPDFEPVFGDDVYATINRASRWIREANRIWEVSDVAE